MRRYDVLLSLHNSKAHNSQLEAWKADIKTFESHQADNDDELRRLRAEAYQVATMYAVFQGVIFTAVAQTSLLNCALWWSPVALSVSVAAAALLAIADKLYSIGDMKEEMKEMGDTIAVLFEIQEDVKTHGAGFDLETALPVATYEKNRNAGYHYVFSRYGISALAFLTCFTVLIALFSMKTLCRECAPSCSQ